ncbi:MAG: ABC transporter ATP-binding protein [Burkholderiaceae bacterium]
MAAAAPRLAPLLKVDGLHAGYGRAEVLSGVSIEAAAGSVVAVVGPNGAGKSTLLNALMGVLPSRGAMRFDGESVQRLSLEQRVERGIALVPETRALFATMPVADNLLLGGYRLRRTPRVEQAARLDEIYKLFPRLHERQAQAAGTLSGGERQMLAIGRALMGSPRLLMLDEPSLGLAPLVVKEIFRIIERLRETGTTILLIEQNARAAMAVADHAYVLETGAIALSGPAAELSADPRVIETYLGKARA